MSAVQKSDLIGHATTADVFVAMLFGWKVFGHADLSWWWVFGPYLITWALVFIVAAIIGFARGYKGPS